MKPIYLTIPLCLTFPVLAETLRGRVSEQGAPVSQATVTLVNPENNVVLKEAHTDSDGEYRLTIGPGKYNLRAGKAEYADQWVNGIVVQESEVQVDITLTPQAFVDSTVVPDSGDCD